MFKKVKHYAGGVEGGMPSWIRKKHEPSFGMAQPDDTYGSSGRDKSQGRSKEERPAKTHYEAYASPKSLSIYMLTGLKAGKFTVEDARRKLVAAPNDMGLDPILWNGLIAFALRAQGWNAGFRIFNDVSRLPLHVRPNIPLTFWPLAL